jgi:hypothetical protein
MFLRVVAGNFYGSVYGFRQSVSLFVQIAPYYGGAAMRVDQFSGHITPLYKRMPKVGALFRQPERGNVKQQPITRTLRMDYVLPNGKRR